MDDNLNENNTKLFHEGLFVTAVGEMEKLGHEFVHPAKLMDHSAAILISGHAGMPNVNAVWVDCNPQRAWLDKNDERKLMNMAYEHMNKSQEWIERFQSVTSEAANQPFANANDAAASQFVGIMKKYRSKFVNNQVVCLSPSAVAAMQEIVMSMLENVPQIVSAMESVHTQNPDTRDIGNELCIILRRLQITRAHFCRVVGRVLGYNHALQQGTAITARRMYQLEVEMRRAIIAWDAWLQNNLVKVVSAVKKNAEGMNQFNFDWVHNAIDRLYIEQAEMEKLDDTEAARNKRKRADVFPNSIYDIPIQDRTWT
jgi:hypothetical protein